MKIIIEKTDKLTYGEITKLANNFIKLGIYDIVDEKGIAIPL